MGIKEHFKTAKTKNFTTSQLDKTDPAGSKSRLIGMAQRLSILE
jgi:hypothetical protein